MSNPLPKTPSPIPTARSAITPTASLSAPLDQATLLYDNWHKWHLDSIDWAHPPSTLPPEALNALAYVESNPALLKALADDFRANGYDLRRLIRLIAQSKRNPETHQFLSTELIALELDLRSIQALLDKALTQEERARGPAVRSNG